MRMPRMSMLRSLVGVGAISIWLWLLRMNQAWTLAGTMVLLLSLTAADRRNRLAREVKTEEKNERSLAFAGWLGYTLAICLGVAWLISVVELDSYQQKEDHRD